MLVYSVIKKELKTSLLGVETFAWRNFRAFRGFADFAV